MYMINKLNELLKNDQKVFSTSELAVCWSMSNKNTLYTTIKRYVASEKLYRIQKGLYSIIKPDKLDHLYVARRLVGGYCYLSLNSILYESGYRSQKPGSFSFVSEKSIRLNWEGEEIRSRQLQDRYLYNDVETSIDYNGVRKASCLRAICDTLYFNKLAHFDKKIDWQSVNELQDYIGYTKTKRLK